MGDYYKKLTLDDFKRKLGSDTYRGPTGARRAIGKFSDWTEAEKKEAHAAIERHYTTAGTKVNEKQAVASASSETREAQGPRVAAHRRDAVAPQPARRGAAPRNPSMSAEGQPEVAALEQVRPAVSASAPTNAELIQMVHVAMEVVEAMSKATQIDEGNKGALAQAMLVSAGLLQTMLDRARPEERTEGASPEKVGRRGQPQRHLPQGRRQTGTG